MSFGTREPQPGVPLDLLNVVRRSRNHRPGFGGVVQGFVEPGYHPLAHAGAFEGLVLANYEQHPVGRTQAGVPITLDTITYLRV